MVSRLYLIAAVAFVAFFLYLTSINRQTVSISFSGDSGIEMQVIPLVFLSFITGVVFFYLYSLMKEAKRYLSNRKKDKAEKEAAAAELRLAEARKSMLLGNWPEARKALEEITAHPYHSVIPYLMRVEGEMAAGNHDAALSIIDDAIPAEFRQDPEVLYYRAMLLLKKGAFERGIDALKLLDERDKSRGVQRALRDAYMGAERWEEADAVQAQIDKEGKKGKNSDDEKAHIRIRYEIARRKLKQGMDDEAARNLKELTKKWPNHAQPYVALGKHYWKKGNQGLAETTWKNGYEKTGNLIFLFIMEDYCLRDEDPQRIIEIYREMIQAEPSNAGLCLFMGKLYLRLEMLDDALEWLNRAADMELKSPYLQKLTGEVCYRQGDYREAAEHFRASTGYSRQVLIPFHCSACGQDSKEWHYACSNCNGWETLRISL